MIQGMGKKNLRLSALPYQSMIVTYEDAKKAAASIRKAVDPYSLFFSGPWPGKGQEMIWIY